jgi:hypothetical protein
MEFAASPNLLGPTSDQPDTSLCPHTPTQGHHRNAEVLHYTQREAAGFTWAANPPQILSVCTWLRCVSLRAYEYTLHCVVAAPVSYNGRLSTAALHGPPCRVR